MKRSGFTIIELMVVIVIMGALLILNVANLRGSQLSARDAERKTDIEAIAANLETYYTAGSDTTQTVGRYPSTTLITGTSSSLPVKVLVVGGGGAGGGVAPINGYHAAGGGGGGGGVRYNTVAISTVSYPIIIGTGGTALTDTNYTSNSGGISSALGIISAGGGSGYVGGSTLRAVSGGSGGGAGRDDTVIGYGNTPSTSPAQGYNGGNPGGNSAGGGGGASGIGGNVESGHAGNGGIGFLSTISGASTYYGGGGAGSAGGNGDTNTGGIGGAGGGGNGKASQISQTSNPGTNGLGGGGAGGCGYTTPVGVQGGAGGSGVVIISYPSASLTATGGTITYTDAGNQNPRSTPAYPGGNTIHTFTSNGTFTVTAFTSYSIQSILRDLDNTSITAPGITNWNQTFIAANDTSPSGQIQPKTTATISPQPSINQYVYQPLQSDGSLCTFESQECRKFNLYYKLETDNTIYMVTSKNQ